MQKRWILATALTLLVLLAAVAQAKPNFSGEWKLNPDKSDFGPMPPPDSMTLKIAHDEPSLQVNTTQTGAQGELSYEAKYTTDGKESTNTIGPMEAKSTANWEGENLLINTKLAGNGMDVTLKSKWTLSEDGKHLTNAVHVVSPQGELDLSYVFDKK
jgi:hypothetical protein